MENLHIRFDSINFRLTDYIPIQKLYTVVKLGELLESSQVKFLSEYFSTMNCSAVSLPISQNVTDCTLDLMANGTFVLSGFHLRQYLKWMEEPRTEEQHSKLPSFSGEKRVQQMRNRLVKIKPEFSTKIPLSAEQSIFLS